MPIYPNNTVIHTVMKCLLFARPQDRMVRGKKNLVQALESSGAYNVTKKTNNHSNKYT